MEFSRVGQHTIKCVISEEEIMELGFSMDEIKIGRASCRERV